MIQRCRSDTFLLKYGRDLKWRQFHVHSTWPGFVKFPPRYAQLIKPPLSRVEIDIPKVLVLECTYISVQVEISTAKNPHEEILRMLHPTSQQSTASSTAIEEHSQIFAGIVQLERTDDVREVLLVMVVITVYDQGVIALQLGCVFNEQCCLVKSVPNELCSKLLVMGFFDQLTVPASESTNSDAIRKQKGLAPYVYRQP